MLKEYSFKESLKKESDPQAQKKLKAFYKQYFKGFNIKVVPYSDKFGKHLQTAGVDKILYKTNSRNYIEEQFFVQEKVCSWNYDLFIFEYEKRSGKSGWAVDESELSDKIVYYLVDEIIVFDTVKLREWLLKNLDVFISKYDFETDNSNVAIPKDVVYDSLDVDVYVWKDDCWKLDNDDFKWLDSLDEEEDDDDDDLSCFS